METQAYQFLKAARFDRFDIIDRMEFDLWQQMQEKLCQQAELVAADAGIEPKYNSRCLGVSDVGGKRIYSFETWGAFSEEWAQTVRDAIWFKVQRLDFRIECELDPTTFAGFAGYVEKNGKYARNVNTFATREREKKEGRHAGGKGVSVGSHKSDRRLVVYKRKGEPGAIELQVSGNVLAQMIECAKGVVMQDGTQSMYGLMREYLTAALEKMARECGFESTYALTRSLGADSNDYTPPADFVAEAPVQMLLQGFDNLPPAEQDEAIAGIMERVIHRRR